MKNIFEKESPHNNVASAILERSLTKKERCSPVLERIKSIPPYDVPFISLNDSEKSLYSGCGLRLAIFKNGMMVKMLEIIQIAEQTFPDQEIEMAAGKLVIELLQNKDTNDEIWFGECSCYQLCWPRQMSLTDMGCMAHVARRISDYLYEFGQ